MKRRTRLLAALTASLLGCVLALPLLAPTPAAADTGCYVNAILVNSCRPWFGATANNYPQVGSDRTSQLTYFETRAGRQMDVVHTYHNATDSALSATDIAFAKRADTYLFTNWKVATTWSDANGSNATVNARIDSMAASIKSLGSRKIFLTLMHEPENDLTGDPNCPTLKYVGTGGTPADYKAMWANVESRFAADGVTNVVWVMDYMNYPGWNCVVQDVYPGDNLVDWIVFNAYQSSDSDVSFPDRVSNLYAILTTNSNAAHDYLSKPWGIVEWGAYNTTQASAYAFDASAQATVENHTFPQLKMYLAFDQTSPSTGDGSYRVGYDKAGNLDPNEQAAFDSFANSPALTGGFTDLNADTTPPTVSLDSPVDGSTVSGTVPVTGTAADDTALADTTLLVDGQSVGTATGGSPAIAWNSVAAGDGIHTLVLRARDQAGHTTDSAAVTVTVHNVVADTTPPSVPAVTATLTDVTTARLSWPAATDDTGVTAYRVYRDGTLIGTTDGTTTSYVDAGLAQTRTYSYTVTAADAAGNTSAASAAATVTTPDTTAPGSPGSLAAGATKNQVSLSWTAATDNVGVTGYRVYRGSTLLTTTTALGFADTTVTDATDYTYSVVAVDAAGNAGPAATVTTATPDGTPPSVPTGLTATGGKGQVSLSWTPSTDNVGVSAYRVYRNGLLIATPTTASYVDTGLAERTTYTYTVAAQDAAGNTSTTAAATATTLDVTPPTAPTSLTAKVSGTKVTLTWKAAIDAGGVKSYTVSRNGVAIATTTALTYADAAAPQGVTSSYTVTATDNAGNVSAASTAATVAVPDKTAPTAPPNLTATAGSKKVTLTWTTSTDNVAVAGYYLYRGSTRIATLAASTVTYTDSGLTSGKSYTYKLVAYDAAGNQSTGSTVTAKAG